MALEIRSRIVGLSWKKFNNSVCFENDENVVAPMTRNKTRASMSCRRSLPLGDRNSLDIPEKMLKRVNSVREAFGTLRQKLKVSTKRKKRLANCSPYPCSATTTPGSARRTRRSMPATPRTPSTPLNTRLYTPFSIDTPTHDPIVDVKVAAPPVPAITHHTPRGIRMGTSTPHRNTPQRILAHKQMAARMAHQQVQAYATRASYLFHDTPTRTPIFV